MDDEPGKRKLRLLWPLLALLCVVALGGGSWLWFKERYGVSKEAMTRRPVPQRMTAVGVEKRVFPVVAEREGVVSAVHRVEVAPRIKARVREILVREGERVAGRGGRPATLMARLDDSEIRSRMDRVRDELTEMKRRFELAEANLTATKRQVETARGRVDEVAARMRHAKGESMRQVEHEKDQRAIAESRLYVLRQELRAARAGVDEMSERIGRAERELAEVRSMLDKVEVRAPVSGVVSRVMAGRGEAAQPDRPLFVVEYPMLPEFRVRVPESLLECMGEGREVDIQAEGLDAAPLRGRVRSIEPGAEWRDVVVDLFSSSDVQDGLSGRLRIPCGQFERLLVPLGAVKRSGPFRFVHVKGDRPKRRLVLTGTSHGDMVEVLSGLGEGDRVLVP